MTVPAPGIPPAAMLDPDAGGHVCPACGQLCPEQRDAAGGWLSGGYAAHYAAEHEEPG